jgi:YHS domain-containing protein
MLKRFLLISCLGWLTPMLAAAQQTAKHTHTAKGIAIQGYDAVAYFTQKKAVKGTAAYATQYDGATYYFSTVAHRDSFAQHPSQYAPQYGGWCAYAMGLKGEKVDIDPETFKVTDGKLYLFYNAYLNNTLKPWNKDETNLRTKADRNWTAIISK